MQMAIQLQMTTSQVTSSNCFLSYLSLVSLGSDALALQNFGPRWAKSGRLADPSAKPQQIFSEQLAG